MFKLGANPGKKYGVEKYRGCVESGNTTKLNPRKRLLPTFVLVQEMTALQPT